MMSDIMTLEQQLLEEIKERQEKLEKLQGVSPKLQQLEALLSECRGVCEEFGMQDLFHSVLNGFATTTPTPQTRPNPATPKTQDNVATATTPQTQPQKLSDKETKAIRQELKTFLEYTGDRLSNVTAKELLIKKLEADSNMVDLLNEVNLDDKDSFLVEAKKLTTLFSNRCCDIADGLYPTASSASVEETIETLIPVVEESKVEEKLEQRPSTVVITEESLKSEDVLKSALVQNILNGYYGTVEQDGVLNDGALVRYPNATELTPLVNLKLISPAIFTPTPIVLEEEIKEESIDMTPQEKAMWDALLEVFDGTELSAMATDKETVDGYNSTNGTTLSVLPIPELYEYTMGVGRIE